MKTLNILKMPEKQTISALSIKSPEYPEEVKSLRDAPPFLYVRGNIECLHAPTVAIAGTRKPTDEGKETARKMGRIFAELGFTVVSGLARGCDTAAHQGCLEAGGKTIAALAHGLDLLYPPENQDLAESIIRNGGCLLSEYPERTSPRPALFVRRNRIIVALGIITVAIEPGITGGTAHAIQFAQAQRKTSIVW